MIPKYSEIVDLLKKGSTIEAQEKIMELRESALELQEQNFELREKVKSLEEQIGLKESVVWDKPHYWIESEGPRDGPYCQRCYDADGKLVRMQGGKNDIWTCKECKSRVYGPNYVAPKPKVRRAHSW